jgi:hypothetical protein
MRHFSTITATVALLAALAAPAVAGDQQQPKHDGKHRQELLDKFDTNHDGKLDDTEKAAARTAFAARIKEKHPELFAKIDTNGDGTLSEDEMKAAKEKLQQLRQHKGQGAGRKQLQ